MPRFRTMPLSGWGNVPIRECRVYRPERTSDLLATLAAPESAGGLISRGMGRSYGDAALADASGGQPGSVLLHTRLNRLISFDPVSGMLECEAGVSVGDILDVFGPRGFVLPVTPGTKFVTIGGAIAADVHGKNHHRDGSISRFVESFDLLIADGSTLRCSPTENADAFWATVGGMGLTGIILTARIRLARIESAYVTVDYMKAPNLDAALNLFSSTDQKYQFSVAWIDCLSSGAAMGRSVLMRGNTAQPSELPERQAVRPLIGPPPRQKSLPCFLPRSALNPVTVGLFNTLFYNTHRDGRRVVDYNSFFYPLDSVNHWSRLYGRGGFVQYQVAFPAADARRGLIKTLDELVRTRRASFLAVLKELGPGGDGLLSFPMAGLTLALDLPWRDGLHDLMRSLERIALDHGARVYLAKDACLSREAFECMYPRLEQFKAVKARLDPTHRFRSAQARRLGIVGPP